MTKSLVFGLIRLKCLTTMNAFSFEGEESLQA